MTLQKLNVFCSRNLKMIAQVLRGAADDVIEAMRAPRRELQQSATICLLRR